jgi:ABC-type antimicrobial peptide transport system permease subunit
MNRVIGRRLISTEKGVCRKAEKSVLMGEISFAFRITPADLGYGLLFAATMGVIGSLAPALRAATMPITEALREA